MNRRFAMLAAVTVLPAIALANPPLAASRQWTYHHAATPNAPGQASEIPAYDAGTNTLWVAGVAGVDVLHAQTGALLRHIDTTAAGSINSVAIRNGVAAFAIENGSARTQPGVVQFYDTRSLALTGSVTVGAQPDMLTFTPDGSTLLVANEGTPSTYGTRTGRSVPFAFSQPPGDPRGSVSIIDMGSRTVIATAGLDGVATGGSHLRRNTGMDFEPEYIAVSADGCKAFVSLQEANAMAVLDLASKRFEKIVGLGAKDFSQPGNRIDPRNDGSVAFANYPVKGLYMPDALATYRAGGQTYIVMANEGDFREDDGDRSVAGSAAFGASGLLNRLRIVNTDSAPGDLYVAGARSFSIRDVDGKLLYDSGELLDIKAFEKGIYDDTRSHDKGVEPEGVTLLEIGGRTLAFIGLERTTKGAVAIFDITDPNAVSYVDLLVSENDRSPEGLVAYSREGVHFLAVANEVSNTTSLYRLNLAPETGSSALLLSGLFAAGIALRWRRRD